MAADGLPAVVDAQRDAGEDVRGGGGEDEEGFEWEGLVVGACEEEVSFGLGDGLGEEGEEGCVGEVGEEVEGWWEGGVFLEGVEEGGEGG